MSESISFEEKVIISRFKENTKTADDDFLISIWRRTDDYPDGDPLYLFDSALCTDQCPGE